jgi:hypothetical protein
LEVVALVGAVAKPIGVGVAAWKAGAEDGWQPEEFEALKEALTTWADFEPFGKEADQTLVAQHCQLVTVAFGEAWRRHWHEDVRLAPASLTSSWRDRLRPRKVRETLRSLLAGHWSVGRWTLVRAPRFRGSGTSARCYGTATFARPTSAEPTYSAADLSAASLYRADLSGASLEGANLQGASLKLANLQGASLEQSNLADANVEGAILVGASLYGANIHGANLYRANLVDAQLYEADLVGANLRGANLRQEDLTLANGDLETRLPEGIYRSAHWEKKDSE